MPTTIPGFFSAAEAADYLGLADGLIRRYCRLGKIKADRVGNTWAISKRELDRFKKVPRLRGNPTFRKSNAT